MMQTHITTVTWTKADTLKHPEKQQRTSYTESTAHPHLYPHRPLQHTHTYRDLQHTHTCSIPTPTDTYSTPTQTPTAHPHPHRHLQHTHTYRSLSADHSHVGREGDQVRLGWVHHLQAPFQVHHSDLLHHQRALSILPRAQSQVGIRKPTAGISFRP